MMREGLRALLEEKLGYECVDEADDGYAAVNKAKEFKPDFVIMDIGLPNLNGIEATRQIKAHQPEIEVVVLSMHATRNYILQVLQAGASAAARRSRRHRRQHGPFHSARFPAASCLHGLG